MCLYAATGIGHILFAEFEEEKDWIEIYINKAKQSALY